MNRNLVILFLLAHLIPARAHEPVVEKKTSKAGHVFTRVPEGWEEPRQTIERKEKIARVTWSAKTFRVDEERPEDADKHCKSLGGELPSQADFDRLHKYMGNSTGLSKRSVDENSIEALLDGPAFYRTSTPCPYAYFFPEARVLYNSGGFTERDENSEGAFYVGVVARCIFKRPIQSTIQVPTLRCKGSVEMQDGKTSQPFDKTLPYLGVGETTSTTTRLWHDSNDSVAMKLVRDVSAKNLQLSILDHRVVRAASEANLGHEVTADKEVEHATSHNGRITSSHEFPPDRFYPRSPGNNILRLVVTCQWTPSITNN